jgi:hypothetical protein
MIPSDVNDRLAKLAVGGNGGVCLSPGNYGKCDPRILWVLRETNGLPAGRSLYDLFRVAEMSERFVWGSIWRRVGLCSYGILNDGLPFRAVDPGRVGFGKAFKGLECISITNAKKAPGKSRSGMDRVLESLVVQGDAFKREMKILQPDLVICGGTWEIVTGWIGFRHGTFRRDPLGLRQVAKNWALDLEATACKSAFGFTPRNGQITFVWAGHPASRGSTSTYYRDTVQGALWALGRTPT